MFLHPWRFRVLRDVPGQVDVYPVVIVSSMSARRIGGLKTHYGEAVCFVRISSERNG